MYRLIVCLLQVSKNKTPLYARSRSFYHSRFSLTHPGILLQVSFVAVWRYSFTKSQSLCMNTLPSCTAWEQKERNPTKDWISKKVTDCLAKTLLVALTVFSNFSSGSLAVNFLVLISIPNTITCVSSASFESFFGIPSKSVTELYIWRACLICSAWDTKNTATKSSR